MEHGFTAMSLFLFLDVKLQLQKLKCKFKNFILILPSIILIKDYVFIYFPLKSQI